MKKARPTRADLRKGVLRPSALVSHHARTAANGAVPARQSCTSITALLKGDN